MNLDEKQRIAEAATPGPWEFHFETGIDPAVYGSIGGVPVCLPRRTSDFEFIAAFNPAVCLELIAKLRKAEETLVGICLTYGHAGESIEDDYAHVYKMARQCLSELRGLGGGG